MTVISFFGIKNSSISLLSPDFGLFKFNCCLRYLLPSYSNSFTISFKVKNFLIFTVEYFERFIYQMCSFIKQGILF